MMTAKDFRAIAAACKDGRDAILATLDPEQAYLVQRIHSSMCATIAHTLAQQNARFDRGRFLAACGISPANHI